MQGLNNSDGLVSLQKLTIESEYLYTLNSKKLQNSQDFLLLFF